MSEILPATFFGHGNPMNALMANPYTEAWQRDSITFPVEGVDGGSISMLSIRVGEAKK